LSGQLSWQFREILDEAALFEKADKFTRFEELSVQGLSILAVVGKELF
jgi:hypothetical protein